MQENPLNTESNFPEEFRAHKCCVIVPTYNNEKTVGRVIEGVLQYCHDVIVVNDGATDSTPDIIASFGDRIIVVRHEQNQGKGKALRNAFKKADELGFEYAITIDSDGQHFPENLPDFLAESKAHPGALIMGARNMEQEGVPGKSSFGNKFSNFWFYVETGIKLPDTQTGYRLYPIKSVSKRKYFTNKFEFEIEVIVKMAWMFVPFRTIPVKVLYDPDERVSHFRPFWDFTRISFLNSYLVTLTILWHLHVRLIRRVWKKGLWNTLKDELTKETESNVKVASAIGFGIFMGIIPIWGFQMLVGAALAKLFRLNVVITLVSSNISIPPMIPLLLFVSYWTGGILINNSMELTFDASLTVEAMYLNLKQYLIGASVFALVAGISMFLISFGLLAAFRKKKQA